MGPIWKPHREGEREMHIQQVEEAMAQELAYMTI